MPEALNFYTGCWSQTMKWVKIADVKRYAKSFAKIVIVL